MGHELNPRPFFKSLDLKCFCELRPGLIGWVSYCLFVLYFLQVSKQHIFRQKVYFYVKHQRGPRSSKCF